MNIKYLQELLSKIDEIKVIGKNTEVKGVVCNVAALVLYGLQMRLIVLEYDEKFQEQQEQIEEMKWIEISELCETPPVPETNRMMMKGSDKNDTFHPFMAVENISVGNNEFEVSGAENRKLNIEDVESIIFLSELLRNGWNPEGVDYQNIDMMFLTSIELRGDFAKIPEFENNPALHFTMGRDTTSYPVERPLVLTVNGEYSEKIWFNNEETEEEHWVQINRVYLSDMWADVERIYSNPKVFEQMTKEEIFEIKKNFEKDFIKICPKGMCFPIVEYECEDGISLEFHTVKYLEATPVHTNGSIGFMVRPDDETGILGMKLKAAVIQDPMEPDTEIVEAKLFKYHKTVVLDDIIM
jgi:hypothetical protein